MTSLIILLIIVSVCGVLFIALVAMPKFARDNKLHDRKMKTMKYIVNRHLNGNPTRVIDHD